MTSVSRQRAKRRRASLARAKTPEHQYMALMSRLLCVELASAEDVHLAKRKLPDRSYYHLILAIGPHRSPLQTHTRKIIKRLECHDQPSFLNSREAR